MSTCHVCKHTQTAGTLIWNLRDKEVKISLNKVSCISAEQLKLFILLEFTGLSDFIPVGFLGMCPSQSKKPCISETTANHCNYRKQSVSCLLPCKMQPKNSLMSFVHIKEVCPLFTIGMGSCCGVSSLQRYNLNYQEGNSMEPEDLVSSQLCLGIWGAYGGSWGGGQERPMIEENSCSGVSDSALLQENHSPHELRGNRELEEPNWELEFYSLCFE